MIETDREGRNRERETERNREREEERETARERERESALHISLHPPSFPSVTESRFSSVVCLSVIAEQFSITNVRWVVRN